MNLFQPIVAQEEWHPNFRAMMLQGNGYSCDVINDWARGFEDRDGKFVKEFQTTFNSSFWEIYVFAVLKKYGLSVDFSYARPDFCLPAHGFNIEAAVALHPDGGDPEYARAGKLPNEDLNEFNRQTIVRLSNAIAGKRRKFVNEYTKLPHVRDRPFVLAVSNFDRPFAYTSAQRAIEAVLLGRYVDEERYIAAGRPGGKLEDEPIDRVYKDNGSPIEVGLFDGPACPEISAVIYSSCATMGKVRALSADPCRGTIFTAFRFNPHSDQARLIQEPKPRYTENLLDGLRVYYNPFAHHPLDPETFRHPSVFQAYMEHGVGTAEQRGGHLLTRFMQRA